jgi:hypothetical protein
MSQQTEAAPPSVCDATFADTPADVPDTPNPTATAEARRLAGLWNEVLSLRCQLELSHAAESRLQAELAAAEKALDYTKGEVANLWRAMTTRNLKEAARKAVAEVKQDARLVRLSEERDRIQSKIADVRSIARRRRWPWSLVG